MTLKDSSRGYGYTHMEETEERLCVGIYKCSQYYF